MSTQPLYPAWPPKLSKDYLALLKTEIEDWSIAHGLAVRPQAELVADKEKQFSLAATAPVTLFPSLFPKTQFDEAKSIQKSYNELYAKIASDVKWLGEVVEELAPHDDFIANLWKLHLECEREGYAQHLSLGLFRSDYMIHQGPDPSKPAASLKQVEFNTIASSFGGLSSKVGKLHNYLMVQELYPPEADEVLFNDEFDPLPENQSIEGLSAGLLAASDAYGECKTEYVKCIIVIVQDPERNTFDQKHIEYEVQNNGKPIFRLPFRRVLDLTSIDSESKALLYHPPAFPDRTYEVSVVYYRAGYSPAEYECYYEGGKPAIETQGWQARLHIERSAAIKCPTVLTHLAGCKKVQQILATPGSDHLANFVDSTEDVDAISATFMPIHPLDDTEAGQEGRRLALDPKESQRYVLKPQREGGGNNIYRSKIPEFLKSQEEKAWAQYILMEMIETPPQRNIILRNGIVEEGGVICELGCYGAVLFDSKGEVEYNEEAGTLLRTKGDQSEEGGVAAGFGAVDSPVLVDV